MIKHAMGCYWSRTCYVWITRTVDCHYSRSALLCQVERSRIVSNENLTALQKLCEFSECGPDQDLKWNHIDVFT